MYTCIYTSPERTDLVDKNLKYYWCRTRVKGTKRLRQSEKLEETVEAKGVTSTRLALSASGPTCNPTSLGLQTAAEVEATKSEASMRQPIHFLGFYGLGIQSSHIVMFWPWFQQQGEKLAIQSKEMLSIGEKISSLIEKLGAIEDANKKTRAEETLGGG